MRVPALIASLILVALLVAGCGGPDDPNEALAEACERQIAEIDELSEESAAPVAKSTEERLEDTSLRECAGQDLQLQAAGAEGEGGADESPSEDEHSGSEDEHSGSEDEGASGAEDEAESEAEHEDETEGEGEGGTDTTTAELDPAARELFISTCGGCHTLSDAGTSGTVGPNLDDTDLDASSIHEVIENGRGAMPAGLLDGEEAQSVAEYVEAAAAAE